MSKRKAAKAEKARKAGSAADAKPTAAGGKPEAIARKAYASVAAIAAGIVARKLVEKAWSKSTGKIPPAEPESPDVSWKEAVGWSVLSGTTVGVARLLATRKAAGAWHRVSGDGATPATRETTPAIRET